VWNHIAATYEAATGIAKLFVNAEERKTDQGKVGVQLTRDWDFAGIGAAVYDNRHFQGDVDEFFIFNCSMGKEKITQIADNCEHKTGSECPSPLLGVCLPCANCTKPEPKPDPSKQIIGPLVIDATSNSHQRGGPLLSNALTEAGDSVEHAVKHAIGQAPVVKHAVTDATAQASPKPARAAGNESMPHEIGRRSRVISSSSLILLNRSARVKRGTKRPKAEGN